MILMVRLQRARVRIQRNDRVSVEIISAALLTYEGTGVARSPIRQVKLRVVTSSDPHGHATGLPGIAGPAVVTCLARPRNCIGFPYWLAHLGVKGLNEAANP